MIVFTMQEETIISALQSKLKEDMDIPENVHYNEGIIDAIAEVEKQFQLQTVKQRE